MDHASALRYTRTGSGQPLVLLHGLGSSRAAWNPVLAGLAQHFDVIAIDLPGFGESAPLPAAVEATPGALAGAVADFLTESGIEAPHLVGNSLGGWVATELARTYPVASLTLLSPAGLWGRNTPWFSRISLGGSRRLARRATRVARWLVGHRIGRVVVLGQTHGRPTRIPADAARAAVTAMASAPGFDRVFRATLHRRLDARTGVTAPTTVAFGSRDLILLPWQSRHVERLPAGTHRAALPGCGHVPMGDDPTAVIQLVKDSVARAAPVWT
jgi:pimeloyl-ACP methyl ester carboxylesterase